MLRVEDESGRVFTVCASGACACGHNACWHVQQAQRVWERDRCLSYLVKFGLHKELRRGDVARAMGFAGIVERLHPGEVKRYLRKIVSEETRNIILLAEIEQA